MSKIRKTIKLSDFLKYTKVETWKVKADQCEAKQRILLKNDQITDEEASETVETSKEIFEQLSKSDKKLSNI